jgi:hypothetical protein
MSGASTEPANDMRLPEGHFAHHQPDELAALLRPVFYAFQKAVGRASGNGIGPAEGSGPLPCGVALGRRDGPMGWLGVAPFRFARTVPPPVGPHSRARRARPLRNIHRWLSSCQPGEPQQAQQPDPPVVVMLFLLNCGGGRRGTGRLGRQRQRQEPDSRPKGEHCRAVHQTSGVLHQGGNRACACRRTSQCAPALTLIPRPGMGNRGRVCPA